VWFLELGRSGRAFESTRLERGQFSNVGKLAFAIDGPLSTWLRLNEEPLVFPGKSGIESFLDPDERRQLEEDHIGACLPIFAVGTLRAIVLLESRRSGWDLSRELGSFLMVCGRHAGLAYETLERHETQVEDVRNAAHAQRLAVAGQLASMVAHEIRNPLGIIRTSIQIVRDSDEGWDKRQVLLTDAISEIDRISDAISGFLSLSPPATRRDELTDLIDLIEGTVRVMSTFADGRRVEISTLNEFPGLRVSGDPRELRQVFLNILLNATQAIAGAGTVLIRTSLFDEPRRDGTGHRTMVLVTVSDDGPGIPLDLIDRMFEPFVSAKEAGTGLGLAICSQIVHRHGGRIWAQNRQPQGATISVSLPLKTGD
jgi:signal transduction histidine kinase